MKNKIISLISTKREHIKKFLQATKRKKLIVSFFVAMVIISASTIVLASRSTYTAIENSTVNTTLEVVPPPDTQNAEESQTNEQSFQQKIKDALGLKKKTISPTPSSFPSPGVNSGNTNNNGSTNSNTAPTTTPENIEPDDSTNVVSTPTPSQSGQPTATPTSSVTPQPTPTRTPAPTATTVPPTATPIPTQTPKPDLLILSASIYDPPILSEHWNFLQVEIKNQGSVKNMGLSNIEATITSAEGRTTSCEIGLPHLNPGESYSIGLHCIVYGAGQATTSIKVDGNNAVTESDESNNTFVYTFQVAQP